MTITKTIKIDVEADQANKELEKFDDNIKETSESTDGLTGSLDSMTGGAVAGFGKMVGGVKKAILGFKSLKVAIAATGIGLLIVSLVAVKTAFTASEEGQNKFAKIMGIIGSVTGNFIDLLAGLGEKIISVFENPKQAIKDFVKLIKENLINRFNGLLELIPQLGKAISLLFKGKFAESGKVAANAAAKVALGVENITDKIDKAIEKTKEFTKELQEEARVAQEIADKRAAADKLDRDLLIDKAKAERDVAEFRDKAARKDLYNAQERKGYLEAAAAINDKIIDQQITAAKLRAEAFIAENKLSLSDKGAKDAQAQAEAELIRLETERFNKRKELGTELSAINQQELAEKQALIDAEIKQREEDQKILEDEFAAEIAAEQAQADKLLAIEIEKNRAELEASKKAADEKMKLNQAVEDAKLDLVNTTSNLIRMIAGEDSKVAKGVAVAQATINAYQGITSTLAAPSVIPEPLGTALKIANAASIGAIAFRNVKNILSTDPSKGGGGARGGATSGGASAPRFNLVQGSGSNQIAEGINREAPIAKAYVVSSDVSSSQELDRKIVQGASL